VMPLMPVLSQAAAGKFAGSREFLRGTQRETDAVQSLSSRERGVAIGQRALRIGEWLVCHPASIGQFF
jgi:hypothetical protein